MGRWRQARTLSGLLVAAALAVPAAASAAIIPDVSDDRAGAQAIESLPSKSTELIERPGDRDWYSILARNPDDSANTVFVHVLAAGSACAAPGSLRIALFNPEGRWMRTSRAAAGQVGTMLLTRNPERYSLHVSAIDPACAGLEYEVTYVATEPPTPDSRASRCLVARAERIDAADRLESLRVRRRTLTPEAQKRYDGYIDRAARTLSRARKSEKRICA